MNNEGTLNGLKFGWKMNRLISNPCRELVCLRPKLPNSFETNLDYSIKFENPKKFTNEKSKDFFNVFETQKLNCILFIFLWPFYKAI